MTNTNITFEESKRRYFRKHGLHHKAYVLLQSRRLRAMRRVKRRYVDEYIRDRKLAIFRFNLIKREWRREGRCRGND